MRPDFSAHERIKREILELEDDQLVQRAFDEFWTTFGEDESIGPVLRSTLLADLDEAAKSLRDQAVLSTEGRGRLRSFLFTARLRARAGS